MSIDHAWLKDYSRYVHEEGDIHWWTLPMEPSMARALGMDEFWTQCLQAGIPIEEIVLRLWESLAGILPRTRAALAAKTFALAILQTTRCGLSLVYFLGHDGDVSARRGYSPSTNLPDVNELFPMDLRAFYQLHDGLVSLMSGDGGPLPSAEWETVFDKHSGAMSLVKIALDGSEAVGFDVSVTPSQAYVLRPSDQEVLAMDDTWEFLDDLMASRIEDL